MKNGPINGMDALNKEIFRLKLEMKSIENKLDSNISGLRHNYGAMALNSIFGEKEKRKVSQVMGMVASGFVNNPKLQGGVSNLVENLTERIADWVERTADRFRKKKD
jgi:hypothetical protein